ncbi:hypothetical protein PDJAM_G00100550, partial [Pangasius djambal]|nr:hypothetical protein [Pangasius djambal]
AAHNCTSTHTLWTIWKCQTTRLWTGVGNRSTRRKPPKHRENMQTPHTQLINELGDTSIHTRLHGIGTAKTPRCHSLKNEGVLSKAY